MKAYFKLSRYGIRYWPNNLSLLYLTPRDNFSWNAVSYFTALFCLLHLSSFFLLYALLISLHIFSLQILLVSLAQKSLKRKPPSKLMFHISYPTLFTTSLGLKIYNQILPSPPPNSSSKISTVSNASSCGLYAICHAASLPLQSQCCHSCWPLSHRPPTWPLNFHSLPAHCLWSCLKYCLYQVMPLPDSL